LTCRGFSPPAARSAQGCCPDRRPRLHDRKFSAHEIASTLTSTTAGWPGQRPRQGWLCPRRARAGRAGGRSHWSAGYRATLSGAVCAASIPSAATLRHVNRC
jgi:hypothetical protein